MTAVGIVGLWPDLVLFALLAALIVFAFALAVWVTGRRRLRRSCQACARYQDAQAGDQAARCQCGRWVRDDGQFWTPDREEW